MTTDPVFAAFTKRDSTHIVTDYGIVSQLGLALALTADTALRMSMGIPFGQPTLIFGDGAGAYETLARTANGLWTFDHALQTSIVRDTTTKTADWTFVLGDADTVINFNHATVAGTGTIPPHSSVAFPVGTELRVVQVGAAGTTIVAGAGVTLNAAPTGWLNGTTALNGALTFRQRATDVWTLIQSTDITGIGLAFQPVDSDLTTIAGLTATTDNMIQSVGSAWASRTPAQVRTALGLVVGTNVQAWDADLDTLAGLTATTDNFLVSVASAWASRTPAQVRTTLGLVVGTNVQAWSARLDTLAGTTDTGTGAIVRATSPALTTPTGIVKADVGLGNVDNTSNVTERAATATLTNKTLTSPVVNTPTGIVAGDIASGVFATARLGSGTANSGVFLRGDSSWVAVPGGGDMLAANNLSDVVSAATARTNLAVAPIDDPTFTTKITAPAAAVSGLTGAVNASRYVGRTTTGAAPTTGTFLAGDWVFAFFGTASSIFVCTTGGTPGTWSQMGAANQNRLAVDTLWDAAGDVVVGSGADTAAKISVVTVAGQTVTADPGATNKVSWSDPVSTGEAQSSTGGLISTYNRLWTPSSATGFTPTSGTLYLFLIPLPKGLTVTTLTVWAGTTAGATLTNSWMAISNSARVQKAISADNTTATWTASTSRAFTMTTPYLTTGSIVHYLWLMIKGTTIPTIEAVTGLLTTGSRNTPTKAGGATTDTGLTTPASGPSTAGTVTTGPAMAYIEVS